MNDSLHICSTGINRLPGDDDRARTVKIGAADFDVSPSLRLEATVRCKLVEHATGPRLELWRADGTFLGHVPFERA